jgi:hypothetical protein
MHRGEAMTRRLFVLDDMVPQGAAEARCDRCRHWNANHECDSLDGIRGPQAARINVEYGYGITLETRADFGCALFEVKQ